jgi:microcystin-dependent protein
MATTTYKGLELQATGTNNNTWGDTLNTDVINRIDQNLGGIVTKSLSNVNVTLTADEARAMLLVLTGTMTGNVTITSPVQGIFMVRNYTTGNFKVTLQYTGGVGATVIPPQGCCRTVISDATNGMFAVGLDAPGTYKETAVGTSALPQDLTGEYVLCDASAISRTTYAQLFNKIGTTYGIGNGTTTFNVPDLRGRSLFGLDDMGGSAASRITSVGSGIVGATMGANGGNQQVTLDRANLPNDSITTSSDGLHTHSYIYRAIETVGSSGSQAAAGDGTVAGTTGSNGLHTHTIALNGGVTQTTVNKMPPAFICNIMIKT